MANRGTLKVTTPTDREIVMTRVFDAPRRLVFEALTKPELLKRWFGVFEGWSLEICDIDLRVGGSYRYLWRGPDGVQMGMRGVYNEILPGERIVNTEKFDEAWYAGEAVGTASLVEDNGKTTLTISVLYDSQEVRDAVLKTPMEQGVAMGYDNLDVLLASMLAKGDS
jgi:uncharacterized protein YndB with AHSA1/START domain